MRQLLRFAGVAAIIAATISCGDVVRQGRSPVYLVIDSLQASPGNKIGTTFTFLISSVVTAQTSPAPCTTDNPCLVVFNDVGSVVLRTTRKDVTNSGSLTSPTTNNEVTINRYHVSYRRADGRNTPGVDVPFGFDGAATGTIGAGGTLTLGFNLVRHDAKREAPLAALVGTGTIITSFADVTFFGQDRVGNDISVTGTIQVEFGDFRNQ